MVHFVLREGAGRADREQFGGNADKPRQQQLFAVELWTEPRHRVKQSPREFLACSRRVIDMLLQIAVKVVDFSGAGREPLPRIPAGVKFSGGENSFESLRHRQSGV